MGDYRKTSAEELTAMANGLREVGDFTEGQKFVFPSSEYDENPTITYWIYSNNNWIEKTAEQAAALTGYTEVEVSELPITGEANILYILVIRQMGFAEAYQKVIDEFYDKVIFGTLTQEDVDGIVYSEPLGLFGGKAYNNLGYFPLIEEITISEKLLRLENEKFRRLHNVKKINIIPDSGEKEISSTKFTSLVDLEEFSYKPTSIGLLSFYGCRNLKFGTDYLDLSDCVYYEQECFRYSSITELVIAEGTTIKAGAFSNSPLEAVYLPDIPVTLANVSAFDDVSSNLKFYVSSQQVINTYNSATNWSDLISKFEVISS